MNKVIQTVGPYAGLLALVATVVLTLLVFSIARDLRRLREWAGGAPERDSEVRELSEIVAEERSQELRVLAEREERRSARNGYGSGSFWDRLGRGGRIMMIVAVVLVVGAAAAWAGTSLLGNDQSPQVAANNGTKAKKKKPGAAAVRPQDVSVAVLNGTGGAETGLAAEYASTLEGKGYSVGAVTNAPETFTTSIVMYTKGNEAAAKAVGRAIDIPETGLMTSDVAAATSGAEVTAVIGADHTDLSAGG